MVFPLNQWQQNAPEWHLSAHTLHYKVKPKMRAACSVPAMARRAELGLIFSIQNIKKSLVHLLFNILLMSFELIKAALSYYTERSIKEKRKLPPHFSSLVLRSNLGLFLSLIRLETEYFWDLASISVLKHQVRCKILHSWFGSAQCCQLSSAGFCSPLLYCPPHASKACSMPYKWITESSNSLGRKGP